MLLLRITGKFFLFAAFLAFALDAVQMLATPREGWQMTSLGEYMSKVMPAALSKLQGAGSDAAPSFMWVGIIEPLSAIPASLVAGSLGAILVLSGYRGARRNIEAF